MKLGVIGGSGVYDLEGLQDVRHEEVSTPFGKPSDPIICGRLGGRELCFVPRHGKGHRLLPSEINHRANIHALKQLGVERVLSISAVGSLKEQYRPRDIVLPDQYFDRTKGSLAHTFFGDGLVAHVGFGDPTCPDMRKNMGAAAREVISGKKGLDVRVNEGGTYVSMEGPAFSTKAESHTYRKMGFDIIGMTSLPEAKLCREAEMCYQAMAMVTDYDCWHEGTEAVTVDMVVGHLMANTALAKEILRQILTTLPEKRTCGCGGALQHAILTAPDAIPAEVKKRLHLIVGKYVK
jgi:5'-methylthioadenosine phosphorylase